MKTMCKDCIARRDCWIRLAIEGIKLMPLDATRYEHMLVMKAHGGQCPMRTTAFDLDE